jgi:hypothetical protein
MIEIIDYQPVYDKKSIVGFFSVKIPEWHMTIARMVDFKKGDQTWIGLPSWAKKKSENPVSFDFLPIISFEKQVEKKFLDCCKKELQEYKQKSQKKGDDKSTLLF